MAIKYSDVCGTVVGIEHALRHRRPPAEINTALDAIRQMLVKIQARDKEYLVFAEELRSVSQKMSKRKGANADAARQMTKGLRADTPDLMTRLIQLRKTARLAELELRACKELAISLFEALEELKGDRAWLMAGDATETRWQAWLPPEPAKAELLRVIQAGEAFVTRAKRGEPTVRFEDGGEMPMTKIRVHGTGRKARLYVEE